MVQRNREEEPKKVHQNDDSNREALWQVLGMYDVCGGLINGIKGMYASSLK